MQDPVDEAGLKSLPQSTRTSTPTDGRITIMRGTAVSTGIGRGTAYVLACTDRVAAPRREVDASEVDAEIARFQGALATAEAELEAIKKMVSEKIGPGEADIFAAQALVVVDAGLRDQVIALIRDKRINAEAALAEVIDRFTQVFEEIADPYLRERADDVRDVGRRLLAALIAEQGDASLDIPEGAIVVAHELLPSVTARLEMGRVRAFVTDRGGKFSHTSILARSVGMPAVTGVENASAGIRTGDRLIVDGIAGTVLVNPNRQVEREYDRVEVEIRADREKLRDLIDLPAVTSDGTAIGLYANIGKLADTEAALMYNADGIGLYRTEFGYAVRDAFPTEDEQYEYLERAAARFHPRKVVFRLLDVGADKQLSYFPLPPARNPSLGERGIRVLLRHPELLKRQLRAFLRVSAQHPVSILLPVVNSRDEIRRVRQAIAEAQAELSAQGLAFDPKIPVGAMIEVPAAALIARSLAADVDFFSLGTNDLVQYVLAADREDEAVASYYQPHHPAVLRLIRLVADAARETGRPLTICGEMAGEPRYTELLLGLGLRELSVASGELLDVKRCIRDTTLAAARCLADEALELGSAAEIDALLLARRPAQLTISAGLAR